MWVPVGRERIGPLGKIAVGASRLELIACPDWNWKKCAGRHFLWHRCGGSRVNFDRTEKGAGRNGNRNASGIRRLKGAVVLQRPGNQEQKGQRRNFSDACAADCLSGPNTAKMRGSQELVGLFHENKT